jgi:hypothetical protein
MIILRREADGTCTVLYIFPGFVIAVLNFGLCYVVVSNPHIFVAFGRFYVCNNLRKTTVNKIHF